MLNCARGKNAHWVWFGSLLSSLFPFKKIKRKQWKWRKRVHPPPPPPQGNYALAQQLKSLRLKKEINYLFYLHDSTTHVLLGVFDTDIQRVLLWSLCLSSSQFLCIQHQHRCASLRREYWHQNAQFALHYGLFNAAPGVHQHQMHQMTSKGPFIRLQSEHKNHLAKYPTITITSHEILLNRGTTHLTSQSYLLPCRIITSTKQVLFPLAVCPSLCRIIKNLQNSFEWSLMEMGAMDQRRTH